MRRVSLMAVLAAFASLLSTPAAKAHPIEAGLAVTDGAALEYLEANGFALSTIFAETWKPGIAVPVRPNDQLANLAPFANLREVVRQEFALYHQGYRDRFPDDAQCGVGIKPDCRKFERNFLDSKAATFELVGVVNRMDRKYRTPETCGEVRLIYRLAYGIKTKNLVYRNGQYRREGEVTTRSRVPMTVNIVVKAQRPAATSEEQERQCAALAKRWIELGSSNLSGKPLAEAMLREGGPLAHLGPDLIDRMETNIQVVRVPATIVPAFGGNAEYLLHVFNWDPRTRTLTREKLENQIDRLDLLKKPEKLAAFKAWLFTPENLYQLAEGTITIPKTYLADSAITSAPGGTARATNRPFLGLISDEEAAAEFARLKEAAAALDPDGKLRNISSGFGLQQRLTDITCTGCHQSRAIGGFHFLGADRTAVIRDLPQNSIFIAGSPHFYADLPRRRAVVEALAESKTPDFGRGFSMRPRVTGHGGKVVFPPRYDALRKGWGANCYVDANGDASFRDWQCGSGLKCKTLHHSDAEPGMGICLNPAERYADLKVGDPFLFGDLTATKVPVTPSQPGGAYRYRDGYCYKFDLLNRRRATSAVPCLPTPTVQPGQPGSGLGGAYQSGGFFGGMHKLRNCNSSPAGTVCGSEAGDRFSDCVVMLGDMKTSFAPCLTLPIASRPSTLRSCNIDRPCRDDYVCLATKTTLRTGLGACLPPYFLFQFRIDGHPEPPEGPAEGDQQLYPTVISQ